MYRRRERRYMQLAMPMRPCRLHDGHTFAKTRSPRRSPPASVSCLAAHQTSLYSRKRSTTPPTMYSMSRLPRALTIDRVNF